MAMQATIPGAGGMLGRKLAARLAVDRAIGGQPIARLEAAHFDRGPASWPASAQINRPDH